DAGVRHDRVRSTSGIGRNGARSDLALRVGYRSPSDWEVYSFAQGTLGRSDGRSANNRYGVGGSVRLSRKLELSSELSGGNGGFGLGAQLEFEMSERTNVYFAYQLSTDRSDTGRSAGTRAGRFTTGGRTRYTDTVEVYGEEQVLHGTGPSGLVHAYGLNLTPNDRWTIGISAENGELQDDFAGDLDRTSATFSLGYEWERVDLGSALEWRSDSTELEDRDTVLFRKNLNFRLHDDWRALSKVNWSSSSSSRGELFDAGFLETVIGLAYRPVFHDRLNGLLKYTYFEDTPSPGQVDYLGQGLDYSQRSHVFSIDATYELYSWLSLGAKYAFRLGELRFTREEDGEWFASSAQLVVIRSEWHFLKKWDAIIEGRLLWAEEAQDQRSGWLGAIYRHVGDNFKVGVGYNFSDFTDDLTDLSYDSQGWFVNLIGKF
ncbi:MAG: flagellar motor protein MotB, partial [Planctomycetota bacterium]